MIPTAAITPFRRVLLGADGTVTHILEAYVDEPVEAVKLLQELRHIGRKTWPRRVSTGHDGQPAAGSLSGAGSA